MQIELYRHHVLQVGQILTKGLRLRSENEICNELVAYPIPREVDAPFLILIEMVVPTSPTMT